MTRRLLATLSLSLALAFPAAAQGPLADADGDGLPDLWESQGVMVGNVKLDLPAMGADPQHKDLFVEIDWMAAEDSHSHKPLAEALEIARDAFARAPVANPDGVDGIRLHLDAGPDSVMNPATGAKWGSLSRSTKLPEQEFFTSGTRNTGPDWSALQAVKDRFFPAERAKAFRYCLFVHQLGEDFGLTSGWARGIPGTDFVVSLGGWTKDVGTVGEQAGTFMHEFGHTIGLKHGGVNHRRLKPNYLSVMNYYFQTAGLRVNGRDYVYDYSRSAIPDLDENALDEPQGVKGAPAGYGTRYVVTRGGRTLRWPVDDASGAIDWNDNGDSTETNLSWDVNKDGLVESLAGFEDWSALVYAAGPIGQARAGEALAEDVTEEMDKTEDDEAVLDLEVMIDLSDDRSAVAGSRLTFTGTVENLGALADVYTLAPESDLGWADFSQVPLQVSLQPGASQSFQVAVTLPADAPAGTEEEIHVSATSLANPDLVDSVSAFATVDPPQAAVPSQDGARSGCFIATAAYGSPLDPHVETLRRFRDERLLTNAPGQAFVALYYRLSPPVAEAIAGSPALRAATVLALTPLVLTVEHPLAALALAVALGVWVRRRGRR